MKRLSLLSAVIFILSFCAANSQTKSTLDKDTTNDLQNLTLNDCIEIALQNNLLVSVAEQDNRIAEARYQQAQSARWPSLDLESYLTVEDDYQNFVFPSSQMDLRGLGFAIPGIDVSSLIITVPEQNIKLADNKNLLTTLQITYPLFTGGKINSAIEQTENLKKLSKLDEQEKNNQIILNTKIMYYSVIYTNNLFDVTNKSYDRLKALLELNESLYNKGSEQVTKIDYLENKMAVEVLHSFVIPLAHKCDAALEGLKFWLGLSPDQNLSLADNNIPFNKSTYPLNDLSQLTEQSNINLLKLNEVESLLNSRIDMEKSEYYPQIALFGQYVRMDNSYNFGYATEKNKNIWRMGLGLKLSLFNGFRTSNKIDEAKAELSKIKIQKKLALSGVNTKVLVLIKNLTAASERVEAARKAMNTASENRELNERAYRNNFVKAEDFIKSQIIESMFSSNFHTALFEHVKIKAELEFLLNNK